VPLASLQAEELRLLHRIMCDLAGTVADTITAYAEDPLFGVPFFLLLVILTATTARGRALLPRTLIAIVIAMGLVHGVRELLWKTVPRRRPAALFPAERVLSGPIERATCAEHPDFWIDRKHAPAAPSFPSSHMITVASAAAVLTIASPAVGVLAWIYACAVAFARLYGGKHWPSDIVGSIVLSVVAAFLAWRWAAPTQTWLRARFAPRGRRPVPAATPAGPPDEGPRPG
jgi:membrane-associated phospholipid phosphatase